MQINKPLVEKPVNAEDHNIYIYYPMSAGGGSKRLFRKVGDRSSEFYPQVNELRREGSYIYEQFVITQGTDVKVYTVGPDYGHAEARKSPVVDGRVKRDQEGLEVRYPVILSPEEKQMARKIVRAFKQTVCGFDILRVQGHSYCCDVNGFSFVKNSRKYYDDASQILAEIMINAVRPEFAAPSSTQLPLVRDIANGSSAAKEKYLSNGTTPTSASASQGKLSALPPISESGDRPTPADVDGSVHSVESSATTMTSWRRGVDHQEELRCVIAVIRHGDRTPKQKMKIRLTEQKYLDYFHSFVKSPRKDLKVKSKSGLLQFLQVTKDIIAEMHAREAALPGQGRGVSCKASTEDAELLWKLTQIRDVLDHKEISGINRKLQMKPQRWNDDDDTSGMVDTTDGSATTPSDPQKGLATEILMILKWGGDLTPLGRDQAEVLGANFRHSNYPDMGNGGVLRLHSTYRHDLKIKASDEGRVMKTAAAFTKGLLELEGQLTPILASLVMVEEKNRQMLDRGGNFEIKEDMDRCKQRLDHLQVDQDMTEELVQLVAPGATAALRAALFSLGNPLRTLRRMHELITEITVQLSCLCNFPGKDLQGIEVGQSTVVSPLSPQSTVGMHLSGDSSEKLRTLALRDPTTSTIQTVESDTATATPVGIALDAVPLTFSPSPPRHAPVDAPTDPAVAPVSVPVDTIVPPLMVPLPQLPSQEHLPVYPPGTPSAAEVPPVHPSAQPGAGSTGRNTPFSLLTETEEGTTIQNSSASDVPRTVPLYLNETIDLMFDRWDQICKAFFSAKTSKFDLTKVPDVYDMVKYDILHNSHLNLRGIEELYKLSHAFENCVVPQEYGTDQSEKRNIGAKMCSALLEKIDLDLRIALNSGEDSNNAVLYQLDESHAPDLQINSLGRSVRTRLYFTSESHMHTLLNVLRYAGDGEEPIICKEGLELMDNISEIGYMSQIVIRLFEDRANPLNFHCELSFSPGATNDPITDKSNSTAPYVLLDKGIKYGLLVDHLRSAIKLAEDDPSNSKLGQRHGSVTVNMDQAGGNDEWELGESEGVHGSAEKKKKKDKKDKKDKDKKTKEG